MRRVRSVIRISAAVVFAATVASGLAGILTGIGARPAVADEPLVAPTSVTKVYDDGRHNAFTALVRWRDSYWLSFRNAPSHGYGEADLIVLRSADAEKWVEAHRVNALPDDRDPQFLATAERLYLYDMALQGPDLTTFVTSTTDGATWSKPQPVYEPRFGLWKPRVDGGRFIATAHRKAEGKDAAKIREAHLITSTDGVNWQKVSRISGGNYESETTIYPGPGDKLTAFLRIKYSVPGFILEASPPYQEWTRRPAGTHFSGHSVHAFRGTTYLMSRTMNAQGGDTGTMIYTYADGKLTPYCKLPSGGDCSYAEAVERGDEMLVSYYSSHEGRANIYLARVPLKSK